MSELTPETRVWVAPDAYDNPTLWTDGPTPDFPRALLVRVSSNADLFDWIVGSLDALAAEKADHAETAAILRRAVAAREEAEAMHAASAQSARDFWQRVESAEARVAELEAGIKALADGYADHAGSGPREFPDALLEQAAKVLRADYESEYDADHIDWSEFADTARAVLKAVAPAIAAQALRDAAREALQRGDIGCPDDDCPTVWDWLCLKADLITKEDR